MRIVLLSPQVYDTSRFGNKIEVSANAFQLSSFLDVDGKGLSLFLCCSVSEGADVIALLLGQWR